MNKITLMFPTHPLGISVSFQAILVVVWQSQCVETTQLFPHEGTQSSA